MRCGVAARMNVHRATVCIDCTVLPTRENKNEAANAPVEGGKIKRGCVGSRWVTRRRRRTSAQYASLAGPINTRPPPATIPMVSAILTGRRCRWALSLSHSSLFLSKLSHLLLLWWPNCGRYERIHTSWPSASAMDGS